MSLFNNIQRAARNRRRTPYTAAQMELMRIRNPTLYNLFLLRRRNPGAARVLAQHMTQQRTNRIRGYTNNYNRWRNSFNIRPASYGAPNRNARHRGPNIPYGPGFHEGAYL